MLTNHTLCREEGNVLKQAVDRMFLRPPQAQRTAARVLSEYDADKYGGLLKSQPRDWAELLNSEAIQTKRSSESEEWISRGDRLISGRAGDHDRLTDALVLETLGRFRSNLYCELGCGFGRFLQACKGRLGNSQFYGGELSQNGVSIARRFDLDSSHFDFTSIPDYGLIRPGTTVFTVQAIEQLPSVECVLAGLRSVRRNVSRVVHIEPGPYPGRGGVLGHLRNAYTAWNAYNEDLLKQLQEAPDIRIIEAQYDVIGINILNPVHVIVWEFAPTD